MKKKGPTAMQNLARVGLLARGTVYFLIGGLAFLLALGDKHGETTDSKGVLRGLLAQPMGYLFLSVLALGLASYALWRVLQAITDSDSLGSDLKGLTMRFGFMLGGLAHLFLSAYALSLMFLLRSQQMGPHGEQRLARWLLKLPLGDLIVGGVGAGILIFGGSQFVLAWREQFCDYIQIPRKGSSYLKSICKFGLMARGFVFMLIGLFFLKAAIYNNSRAAGGVKEAWQTLHAQPFGKGLVAVVALGMISYGLFSAIEAKYRKQA